MLKAALTFLQPFIETCWSSYKIDFFLFQDGANAAFHEAVGDSINYAVHAPVHLERLDLVDGERGERERERENSL